MIDQIKRSIKRALPSPISASISANRWWSFLGKACKNTGMHEVCVKLISKNGDVVRWGPFAGLRLPPKATLASANSAALVGTYEMELHPWLQQLVPGKYERLLDIGAAEGYYAIGMALRTGSRVDAFDPASVARRLCRSTANLNGVSHLVCIHSFCSRRTLLQLAGLRCFILSDCEGYEASLFSEDVISALTHSDLIIELHDGSAPSGTMRELLIKRFKPTHGIQIVRFRPRDSSDFPDPALAAMLGKDAIRVVREEGRSHDQEWLIATAIHEVSPESGMGV